MATGLIKAAPNQFDPNNPDHVAAAKGLATGLQQMIASGDEAGAKALYNQKQSQFGFTDADIAPYTANMGVAGSNGFDPSQINAWKASPVTPVTTTPPVVPTTPDIPVTQASRAPDVVATTDTTPVAEATASTATPAAPVAATPATASTYTAQHADAALQAPAVNWNVTEPQTVAGQVEQIIAKNSPLQQQAEGLANQRTNARGLINSSIGAEAGMNALYQNALPMAQQDASTNAGSAQYNAQAQNAVNSQNSQIQTNVNLANAGYSNTAMQFNANTATDISKTNVANALQAGIVNQAQANDLSKFNANLLTTVDLSNVKDANEFQQFALKQAFDAQVINQDQYNKLSIFNADASNKAALTNATLSAQERMNILDNNTKTILTNASLNSQEKINALDNTTKTILTNATLSSQEKQNLFDNNTKTAIATADNENKLALTKLDAEYRQTIQASASASQLFAQTAASISAISNSTMDETAKDAAIANQYKLLKDGMGLYGAVADIPGLDDLITIPTGKAGKTDGETGTKKGLIVSGGKTQAEIDEENAKAG